MTEASPQIDPTKLGGKGVRAVIRALSCEGATVRFVGGCVRNALLGAEVTDVDLVIDRPPEESQRLLEAAGIMVKPIGIQFGTVLAVLRSGESFEVTSLRKDIDTDGRWATVEFGTDWTADAERRDFTMNALYADLSGTVFDPIGGLPDLRVRRVRFIGSPTARIREDYLRILRFFRFQAWYGVGPLDLDALKACVELRHELSRLSAERVGAEMRKLLGAPNPAAALDAAFETGVLVEVLPSVKSRQVGLVGRLVELEQSHNIDPAWQRRWLLIDGGDAAEAGERMALSRREARELEARRKAVRSERAALAAGYRWGAEVATDMLLVRAVHSGEVDEMAVNLSHAKRGAEATMPITGKDLLAGGLPKGQKVGVALARAEAAWLASDLAMDREQLLAVALEEAADDDRS